LTFPHAHKITLDTVLYKLIHCTPMATNKTIGKHLKAFRLDLLMTQTKVAEHLGISRATVARLERGENCSDLMRAKIMKLVKGQGVAA